MTDHKNVFMALAAAQSEMEQVVKGAINPAFRSRYAGLDDVVQIVRPALNRHGIAYFHQIETNERGSVMRTVLWHGASDTHVNCDVPLIVDKNNMQGFKSATTYAKRIGVESLTGIAPQDDDDGNAAVVSAPKAQAPKAATDPAPEAIDYITAATNLADLQRVWGNIPPQTQKIASVIAAKDKRKAALINPPIEGDLIPY